MPCICDCLSLVSVTLDAQRGVERKQQWGAIQLVRVCFMMCFSAALQKYAMLRPHDAKRSLLTANATHTCLSCAMQHKPAATGMRATTGTGVCASGVTAHTERTGTTQSGWTPTTTLCLTLDSIWRCGTRHTCGRCVYYVCLSVLLLSVLSFVLDLVYAMIVIVIISCLCHVPRRYRLTFCYVCMLASLMLLVTFLAYAQIPLRPGGKKGNSGKASGEGAAAGE